MCDEAGHWAGFAECDCVTQFKRGEQDACNQERTYNETEIAERLKQLPGWYFRMVAFWPVYKTMAAHHVDVW